MTARLKVCMRLLGRNSELVLHGGGNTSVKTSIKDIDNKNYDVLCVKGSGWDMADIEPAGLPAVKLDPLLALRNKKYLSEITLLLNDSSDLVRSMAVWALKEILSKKDFELQKKIYYKKESDPEVKNEWTDSDNQIQITH